MRLRAGLGITVVARTFAIGDIHGHTSKLRKLLGKLRERAEPGDSIVFVGDYIDRGPDSRGVIDIVLELRQGKWEGPVVSLKGNHEVLMIDSLSRKPLMEEDWLRNGGWDTMSSYTSGAPNRRWTAFVPPSHLEFLEGLQNWHEDEHALYVHAGIPPGVPVAEAREEDLLWIREPFLESDYQWEKVVVFGHTPQYDKPAGLVIDLDKMPWRPLDRPEKIGIDTGAAYGGPLSAVMLPEREFFSAR